MFAASQMWYCRMNSSSEIRPNQAKNELYQQRTIPLMFRRTMKEMMGKKLMYAWISLHSDSLRHMNEKEA